MLNEPFSPDPFEMSGWSSYNQRPLLHRPLQQRCNLTCYTELNRHVTEQNTAKQVRWPASVEQPSSGNTTGLIREPWPLTYVLLPWS